MITKMQDILIRNSTYWIASTINLPTYDSYSFLVDLTPDLDFKTPN
jgi:hypothetical protein